MVERTEALVLQMSADIRRLEKAMNQARGTTNRQLTEIEKRFDRANTHIKRSGDQLARDLRASVAAIGVGLAVRELTDAADRWTNLRNQVRQYERVVGPVTEATERLTTVASDAGVAVDALGTTFAASARAAATLKRSGEDVFAFNEAVAKGAAIANTGVSAVDGALRQLGQAIASPRVQLQEFQSVIEGTPRLAQAFADGIERTGGSVAKLRQLIADQSGPGIAGSELFEALIKQLPILRDEFAKSEATVSRSITRLNNAFIQYVGRANTASGVTATLSGFIDEVAENFDLLADAAIVAASVLGGTLAAGAIARLVTGLVAMISATRTATSTLAGLRLAFTFFTGPVGAVILAIGAAVAYLGLRAREAATPLANLEEALGKLETTQAQIRSDTDLLTAANDRLTVAMAGQGEVSIETARLEVEAISRRIAANKRLAESYQVLAREQVSQIQNDPERNRLRLAIATQAPRAFPGASVSGQNFEELRQRIREAPTGSLNEQQIDIVRMLSQLDAFEARIAIAMDRLRQLQEIQDVVTAPPSGGGVLEAAASELSLFQTDLEKFEETLAKIRKSKESDTNKSRAATQALIEFAKATKDIAKSQELLGSLDDILSGGDWGIIHSNLRQIQRELDEAGDELKSNAEFLRAVIGDIEVDDLVGNLPEFEDESQALREAMRDATKDGIRDGITTGDWGDALRSIIAEAIVQGMDDSLNKFADMLTALLFGQDGRSGWIQAGLSAVGSIFGGGRATGGPVTGGRFYRVGEHGPEYLMMGRGQGGQVFTAAQMNSMMAGGRSGGGTVINAPFNVLGSIDAVTWPKVQAELQVRDLALRAAFPSAVNATLVDNRRQKRRL